MHGEEVCIFTKFHMMGKRNHGHLGVMNSGLVLEMKDYAKTKVCGLSWRHFAYCHTITPTTGMAPLTAQKHTPLLPYVSA